MSMHTEMLVPMRTETPVPQRKGKIVMAKKPEKKSSIDALHASANSLQQMSTELVKSRENIILAKLAGKIQEHEAKYTASTQQHQDNLGAQDQRNEHFR